MARAARRYDVYLPLAYNDGKPIPNERFTQVEGRLLAHFGGVTGLHRDFPLRGIWRSQGQLFLDQVIILTAIDFRKRGSSRFIRDLKQQLLRDFEQLEILITESPLRIH
jgi:hypothetical protein